VLRLARASLLVDDVREASSAGHRAHALALEHGERANAAWAELLLADAARESNPDASLAHYERAIESAGELALKPLLLAARSGQSRLLRSKPG
jgi:hypothetical protein